MLDLKDWHILQLLQKNSRSSNAEIGREVGLSAPTIYQRIKRMTSLGYITQHTTILDPQRIGYGVMCFVYISLRVNHFRSTDDFISHVSRLEEVLECYVVSGAYDVMLKVVATDQQDIYRFLTVRLTPHEMISRIETTLVLNVAKSVPILPIERFMKDTL